MTVQQQQRTLNLLEINNKIHNDTKMDPEEKKRAASCIWKMLSFPQEGRILCYSHIESLDNFYTNPGEYSSLTYFI